MTDQYPLAHMFSLLLLVRRLGGNSRLSVFCFSVAVTLFFLPGFCMADEAQSPCPADWARPYRDSIRYCMDNGSKQAWIQEAQQMAAKYGDTLAFFDFKVDEFRLLFSKGDYRGAFDSLFLLEQRIARHLGIPSLLDYGNFPKDLPAFVPEDSLWVALHVKTGVGLAEEALYLNSYEEAVDITANIMSLYSRDSNDIVAARCYNVMGAVFAHRGLTKQGQYYLLRSLDCRSLSEDMQAIVYANLSAVHAALDEGNEALHYALECYNLLRKNHLLGEQYIYALYYIGIAYEELGEYALAENQLAFALSEASLRNFGHLCLYIRGSLIRVLFFAGKIEEVEALSKENLEAAVSMESWDVQLVSLVRLAQAAELRQDYRTACFWLDSAYRVEKRMRAAANDLRSEHQRRRLEYYRSFQEMEQVSREAGIARSGLKYKNLTIGFCLVAGLFLLVSLLVLYRRLQAQKKLRHQIRAREGKAEILFQDRMEDLKDNMGRALDERDKDLMAQALYAIKIRGLVAAFSGKLHAMRLLRLDAKGRMYVMEMERLLKDFSPGKDWEEFELYFKRVDQDFWIKLENRFPDLTSHDKRLCAFIWLRLSPKEIASITNRAVRSVYTAKNRLKKKLGLEPESDLYDFLHSL